MKVIDVNTPSENTLKSYIERLKVELKSIFSTVNDNGEIYIVCDFPSVTDYLGKTSLLIFIKIPYEQGSYYRFKYNDKWVYLESLILGINFLSDDAIVDIDDYNYYSNDGEFAYTAELKKQSVEFDKWGLNVLNHTFRTVFFEWIKSSEVRTKEQNDYIILNKPIDWKELIVSSYKRIYTTRTIINEGKYSFLKCSSLSGINSMSLKELIELLIDRANENTRFGILTKKKVDQITSSVKISERIKLLQGKKLCLVSGKAGAGKTLALMRTLYGIAKQNEHVRLLTYNNLLVKDIKQYIRNLPNIRNTNISIDTLHHFFYELSKKMHVSAILQENRISEILNVKRQRISIAEQIIHKYLKTHEQLPFYGRGYREDTENLNTFIENLIINFPISPTDRTEVIEYLTYVLENHNSDIQEIKENYINHTRNLLLYNLGRDVFIKDYNKILEVIFLMLDNTKEFIKKYDIKNRRLFLSILEEENSIKGSVFDEDFLDDFNKFIKQSTQSHKWSRSIIIDEGQDCNVYEKLIIMKLRGSNNLIVATSGSDQLIRKPEETDWRKAYGKTILYEEIKLGRTSFRQKGNLIKFINAFSSYYSLSNPLQGVKEFDTKGEVIIDLRKSLDETYNKMEELLEKSEIMGCSPYEGLMLLIPTKGFTDKKVRTDIQIDDADYVQVVQLSSDRRLSISTKLKFQIWDGTKETKRKLPLPYQNQVRCLYYESCRGLESWSVICLNLDRFFYTKYHSSEAKKYAMEHNEIFQSQQQLKKKYALFWCNMAFTRAIDTLYIKIENQNNEFSKELLNIAENCGDAVTILQ